MLYGGRDYLHKLSHMKKVPSVAPVLMAGGSGTRLWPLSRKSHPKQFARIVGDLSLFQQAAQRLAGATPDLLFLPPTVVTGSDFRFVVTEQLAEAGVDPGAVLIEPEVRNTAPAILAAALHLQAKDPDGVMLVAPADHVIPDASAFRAAVARGMEAVSKGRIVTFGIAPNRPETGYGYLELAERPDGSGGPVALSRFVEKPDALRAAEMLSTGRHMWNAGIFLARAADMVAAFETHAPEIMAPVRASLEAATDDLGFLRLEPAAFSAAPSVSIDYAVMEKASNLAVVSFAGHWSDLG